MDDDVELFPVVETGALEFAVVDAEAERLDQVQRASGGGTEPRDVAGVRWNLRFDQRDVQRRAAEAFERNDAFVRLHVHDARMSA